MTAWVLQLKVSESLNGGVFLSFPLTQAQSHISKHCEWCIWPLLMSGCTTGWASAGELACSAGSTQVPDSFRRPLMFFASPAPSLHHLLGLPLAGNCILSTAIADKWGRRGAAHCHQPTWPVSHCNLQCVSHMCSYPAPTAGLGERKCMCTCKYTHTNVYTEHTILLLSNLTADTCTTAKEYFNTHMH